MKLAVVARYVVCTVCHERLTHDKLLMVKMLNAHGEPNEQRVIAIDNINAGYEEWVLLISGGST